MRSPRAAAHARRAHAAERPGQVIVASNELLVGVLDKAQLGASPFGLVHACDELYGGATAGRLLSACGRLLTYFLQSKRGFTVSVEDLVLTRSADSSR